MLVSKPISGRILSIETDPLLQKQRVDYLAGCGFTLLSARTQEEGLTIFRHEKPDLILSPAEFEALELIHQESPQTPVIIITDHTAVDDAVHALRLGAWDYILEPITDFSVLEHSICRALERTHLIEENNAHRKALERDQEAGRQVQMQLLPASDYSIDDYHFHYKILPSLYLSGDFIDYFPIHENLIGFYIADVSGHGASSAFVTVLLKSFVAQLKQSSIMMQPHLVLKALNEEILKAKLGKYLTMIYGILDTKNHTLEYSYGGHYPKPILYDGQKAQYLEGEGFAVGLFEKASYETYQRSLPSSFSLMMYSDGILEILPGKDLEENEALLLKCACDPELTASNMLERLGIKEENCVHLPDDIAFLIIRNGTKNRNERN